MLLFTTQQRSKGTSSEFEVDLKTVININVHELKEKKAIDSPAILFERIFRFAQKYEGHDPLMGLTAQEVRVSYFEAFTNAFIEHILGKEAKANIEYARQFGIKDVSKSQPTHDVLLSLEHSKQLT